MTRIYFKPQSCSVRNPRSRKPHPLGKSALPHQQSKDDGHAGWRSKLDPDAIEQIADGLEKMVLSWTQPKEDGLPDQGLSKEAGHVNAGVQLANGEIAREQEAVAFHSSPICEHPGTADRSFIVAPNSRPISAMSPAIEEMMRGELLKSCLPTITNGDAVLDQSAASATAETRYWYLTPAKSLPNCGNREENKAQDGARGLYGALTPLDNASNIGNAFEIVHQGKESKPKQGKGNGRKGARIHSIDEESDSDGNVKEAVQQENAPPEKISYHIKTTGSNNWSETIEINGGNRIIDLLGKKLTNPKTYPTFLQGKDDQVDVYKKKVEELQIALLECAMEYEVKIVEMEMKMLHMKSEQRQKEGDINAQSKTGSEKLGEEIELIPTHSHQERTDRQRVEYLRKQLCKVQREKLALTRQLNDLRKRERQFDLQRRSLDDALGRVNSLQRELVKKEQEIVDCQLREKEVRAQLYEVQLALHKSQAAQIEPRKLLSLLPALREWLHTIKKVPCEPTFFEPHDKSTPRTPPIDSIVSSVTKEIQALQKALSKLATKK